MQGKNGKNFFYSLMWERYGTDELYFFMFIMLIALLLLNFYIDNAIIAVITLVLPFFMLYRAFSKDIPKRKRENDVYLKTVGKIFAPFILLHNKRKMKSEYYFIKCKDCDAVLRVPKDEEKITLICTRCGERVKTTSEEMADKKHKKAKQKDKK